MGSIIGVVGLPKGSWDLVIGVAGKVAIVIRCTYL